MSNNRPAQCAIALLILGGLFFASVAAIGEESSNAPNPTPLDLAGKIIVVLVDRSNALEKNRDSEVIENPQLQEIGGRLFIFGTAVSYREDTQNWRHGAEVGVAWEEVSSFYLYSRESFRNYVESRDDE